MALPQTSANCGPACPASLGNAILGTERCCSSFKEAFDFLCKDRKRPRTLSGAGACEHWWCSSTLYNPQSRNNGQSVGTILHRSRIGGKTGRLRSFARCQRQRTVCGHFKRDRTKGERALARRQAAFQPAPARHCRSKLPPRAPPAPAAGIRATPDHRDQGISKVFLPVLPSALSRPNRRSGPTARRMGMPGPVMSECLRQHRAIEIGMPGQKPTGRSLHPALRMPAPSLPAFRRRPCGDRPAVAAAACHRG